MMVIFFSRNITCKAIVITNSTHTELTTASITNEGDIYSRDITCRRITISGTLFKQPVETIIMSCLNPTANPTGATVPGWSLTWQGNGRNLKVSCQITCFSETNSVVCTWSLRRRIVGSSYSSEVATGKFFFKQTVVHMTMPTLYYVDISSATQNIEYFVVAGNNTQVDTNDVCTMITTEYF